MYKMYNILLLICFNYLSSLHSLKGGGVEKGEGYKGGKLAFLHFFLLCENVLNTFKVNCMIFFYFYESLGINISGFYWLKPPKNNENWGCI